MNTPPNYIEKLSFKYGALTAGGLIAYFLIMKLLGLVHIIELRVFNFFILTAGVALALRKYRDFHQLTPEYLKGLGIGMLTSVTAVLIFAVFLLAYLLFIDPQFMETIKANEPLGSYLNPYIASFTIIFEGVGSGYLITFIVMQFMKKSHLKNL